MQVKSVLLTALEANRGEAVSGATLARTLGVSRNAVWKAVLQLRSEGYPIETIRARGYALRAESDRLSAEQIALSLQTPLAVEVVEELPSTNAALKLRALAGAPEGTVLIARTQTAGRGRLGRAFYSPNGGGLYMSLLLRPKLPVASALFLTAAAAVAVCEAIEANCALSPQIKWVNDVFVSGRKVAGILTEASMDVETGLLAYVIVGIGLNVTAPEGGFPPDISDVAGALYAQNAPTGLKSRLAAQILDRLTAYAGCLPDKPFLGGYQARSLLTGVRVVVHAPSGQRPATALRVDEDCRLIVRYDDGVEAALSTGEVSVKPMELA